MKKIIILLFIVLLIGDTSNLRGQCYGVVHFDNAVNANGATTFSITTTKCNELIMISYDGWMGPGNGPVNVDAHAATHINTAFVYYYAVAETYAYIAATAGVHTITCTEPPYTSPYYLNSAACFYVTGSGNPISIGSLTSTFATVTCVGGGPVTDNITTTIPGSMIYDNFDCNNGQGGPFTDSWTGATFMNSWHIGNGIDQSEAYTIAATPGTYTVTANCSSNPGPCGGLALLLVAIPPPLCGGVGGLQVVANVVNPTCGSSNGNISLAMSGGASPYTYTWNPVVSSSANATGLSAGTYSVTVNDGACHDTSMIFILPPNILALTANVTANVLCNGFSDGSAMATVSGGTPSYTYIWAPTGGNNAIASDLSAGTYTIIVKDALGCVNSAAVTITQPQPLTAGTQVSNVLCYEGNSGSSTVIPAGGTPNYTYTWTPTGQTGATASNLSVGTYIVEVRDNNGCTVTASSILTQPTALSVALTGPQVICVGMSGTLTATATGGTSSYTYNWTWINGGAAFGPSPIVKPTSNTIYSCMVTDANGCTVSSSIKVDLGPPLVVTESGPKSTCSGNSVILCGNATGGFGLDTYTWQPGNLSGPCVSVAPTISTTYSLMVQDQCGGDTTVTVFVFVSPLPDVAINADVQQGCSPLCVQFQDLSALTTGKMASWSWNFGNKDSSHKENPAFCYVKPGSFTVNLTVVSDSGCSSSLNIPNMINVYSHPVAKFNPAPQPTTILTPHIQFTDKSTDPYGIVYWFWNFGDNMNTANNTSNLENPSYTYSDTGTYCAQLVAMNMHGCTDTTTDCIVIDPIFNLYIPSGFTPNGTGINEVFQAKGSYIKSFEMYIFDRWGMQLFHSIDINNGWNGTVKGGSTIVQEDTYIYQIYATDSQNKSHTYIGQVNLLK